eukprot:CAMPEP_0118798392 /NCGR_PEP_ID=MMETSP1161-20130426/798_1 /TAXON_ID=249345 /ORGANISM="Picochlorum oklahomensis, Strain CCMP2329" /LENGTH=148 /DNA_ID=CAMNT_0006725803 /DNA_START=114 /DNA_END=561 /DNA_ORIENTATION=+
MAKEDGLDVDIVFRKKQKKKTCRGSSPPQASSSGGESKGSGRIRQVNEEELEVEIVNREKPLIIDFFATWCGPCVMLQKELEQVAETLGDSVQILKIDCDENEGISSALQIQGLPTLIFVGMDADKPALRTEGLLPAQSIIDIIQNEM